ncbi:MAG: ATP-binding cassette domain-containing protein, partial [Actinomycetota bacterium]
GPSRSVTMVFQGDSVYEHLSVEGNLSFPLTVGEEAPDRRGRVRRTARRFSLDRVLERTPDSLSVGQRRAVSAARATIRSDITVALLDDPLVGADRHLRRRLLESIIADRSLTVVFSTREGDDTLRWADRVAVLAGGRIAQEGVPIDVYRRPVSLEVAEMMGEINRIPATVSRREDALEVAGSRLAFDRGRRGPRPGERVVAGVRPSRLEVAGPGTPFSRRLRGTVGRIEPLGPGVRVLFGLGDRKGVGFSAVVGSASGLEVGDPVDWSVRPGSLRLYDPRSGRAL